MPPARSWRMPSPMSPGTRAVKSFLQSSNDHGWDVKRKLVWLGTHSFMFRTMFARYIDEEARGKADIGHTDDFICQHCTRWSGLGAIDILAGTLDISEDDRRDLRSWYERHTAFYRIAVGQRRDPRSRERRQRPAVPDQN